MGLEDILQEGSIVRFRSVSSGRFLRAQKIPKKPDVFNINCSGGNGQLTRLRVVGSPDAFNLVSVKFDCIIKTAKKGKVTGIPSAKRGKAGTFKVDANPDGTVCFRVGDACLTVMNNPRKRAMMAPYAVNPSTSFTIVTAEGEVDADDSDGDSEPEELDDSLLEEDFAEIMKADRDGRRALLKALPAAKRRRFKQLIKARRQNRKQRRALRNKKREHKGVAVNEEKQARRKAREEKRRARLAAQKAEASDEETDTEDEIDADEIDAVLESESSEDEVGEDPLAAEQERQERLQGEAAAAAAAAVEAQRKALAEERARVEAARQAMEAERERMRKQMEEEMEAMRAAAAAEAEAEAAAAAEEEDQDQELDEATQAMADADLNENATESSVELPPAEGAVKDDPNFDAEASAAGLYKAMKGFGCDDIKVLQTIGSVSNAQRQEIIAKFKRMYGKDLVEELKGEIGGKFRTLILGMLMPPADFDAKCMREAMKGLGTSDDTLIEILCTRDNKAVLAMREAYKRMYSRDLEKDVMSETSGNYKRLLVSMLQGGRDESLEVDMDKAKHDAELLHKSTKGWTTDKSTLNHILALRSGPQIRATCAEYMKLSGRDITKTLYKRMPANLAKGMVAIVSCARNPARYFANKIYKACKGIGTNDDDLMRIMISRSEVDMKQIMELFPSIASEPLRSTIKGECSKNYRRTFNKLMGYDS